VDARIPGSKLHIEVNVGQKDKRPYIAVVDDGTGMSKESLADAMVMGRSSKDGSTIGEFGFGMKTACSNLGAVFEIVTATSDSDNAWQLTYDETKFIEGGRWEIETEAVDKPFDHGTRITIWEPKVNLYAGVKNAILEKFGKIFKRFISANEVEMLVNNTDVVPFVRDTINDYDTEIAFEINGKPVAGWASLATKGSGRGQFGFDLIRHNRVVVEHVKLGFKASSTTSRIVGELHLNDFAVTNNKTAFRDDTDDMNQLNAKMEEILSDLKRENRRLANPGKFSPKDQAEVEEYIDDVKAALKDDDLQADLDRRALDADLADEFAEGPVPFEVPDDAADDDGEEREPTPGVITDPRTDHTDTRRCEEEAGGHHESGPSHLSSDGRQLHGLPSTSHILYRDSRPRWAIWCSMTMFRSWVFTLLCRCCRTEGTAAPSGPRRQACTRPARRQDRSSSLHSGAPS
jgi:hypothetical protein